MDKPSQRIHVPFLPGLAGKVEDGRKGSLFAEDQELCHAVLKLCRRLTTLDTEGRKVEDGSQEKGCHYLPEIKNFAMQS